MNIGKNKHYRRLYNIEKNIHNLPAFKMPVIAVLIPPLTFRIHFNYSSAIISYCILHNLQYEVYNQ